MVANLPSILIDHLVCSLQEGVVLLDLLGPLGNTWSRLAGSWFAVSSSIRCLFEVLETVHFELFVLPFFAQLLLQGYFFLSSSLFLLQTFGLNCFFDAEGSSLESLVMEFLNAGPH